MPARRRAREAAREAHRAGKRPDLRSSQVEVVGVLVQTNDAWQDRTCPTCSSAHCSNVDHWPED